MSNAMLDIDRYLAERSDAELAALAGKAVQHLMDRHPENGQALPLPVDGSRIPYFVVAAPTGMVVTSREEFMSEARRRLEQEPNDVISAQEFVEWLKQ